MQLGFGASSSRLDSRCDRWVNGTAKLCRLQLNCVCARAKWGLRRPSKRLGGACSDARRRQNNGRVRTWSRNEAEMKRMGNFFLLTIGAGESSRAWGWFRVCRCRLLRCWANIARGLGSGRRGRGPCRKIRLLDQTIYVWVGEKEGRGK
jgi:hypothetical protein